MDEPREGTWFKAAGEFFRRVPGESRDFGGLVGVAIPAGRAKIGPFGFLKHGEPEWVRFDDITKLNVDEFEVEGALISRELRADLC